MIGLIRDLPKETVLNFFTMRSNNHGVELRPMLPTLRVPTLVLYRLSVEIIHYKMMAAVVSGRFFTGTEARLHLKYYGSFQFVIGITWGK